MSVLGIFSFLSFGWADILDILMVALIIFFLIRSIRKDSGILNIVLILAVLLILQALVKALKDGAVDKYNEETGAGIVPIQ